MDIQQAFEIAQKSNRKAGFFEAITTVLEQLEDAIKSGDKSSIRIRQVILNRLRDRAP